MSTILVTGAAGYIGSHTSLELLNAGHEVVGVDNFDNSSPEAVRRVNELAGRDMSLFEIDLRETGELTDIIARSNIDAVVHFAGLKAVGESVEQPLLYFDTNLTSTISLLKAMEANDVRDLVFSSSCTVYGDPAPEAMPLDEATPRAALSPYGRTKLMIEHMLEDIAAGDDRWRLISLRYFNPVGAHPSGRIGEDPRGIPNNLMPYIMQVAVGRREHLTVNGADYPTPDGTCVRDYIHVVDLARGHLRALEAIETTSGAEAINLGTGVGSSVLEVVNAASAAVGEPIPYEIGPRRSGDSVTVYADPSHAAERLNWRSELTLDHMVADHWNWQKQNPDGY